MPPNQPSPNLINELADRVAYQALKEIETTLNDPTKRNSERVDERLDTLANIVSACSQINDGGSSEPDSL